MNIKQFLLLITFLGVGHRLVSQNYTMISAFTKSYERERLKDYNAAIKALTDLHDTIDYEVILRLGWLHYKAGLKTKSMGFYQKAIQMKPRAIEPRLGFGFPAYELENFNLLIEQDKKILEIDPNNKVVCSNLAHIYFFDRDYKKSLQLFTKVVEQYPFDYDNNLNLGLTLKSLGKNEEAEQYLRTTLLYSPTDALAKEALEAIGKPFDENDPLVKAFSKSYDLANQSKNKEAIAVLKEVYDKSSYFVNLRLGWLHYLDKSYNESLIYYKAAASVKPGAIEAKLGLSFPLEAMGNKNELKAQYENILTIDSLNTFVHYKLGMMYYDKKEFNTAFKFFEKVVALYPFDYDGLLMFAWTNHQLGNTNESKDLFSKVLCLSPGDVSATRGLTTKAGEDPKLIIKPK